MLASPNDSKIEHKGSSKLQTRVVLAFQHRQINHSPRCIQDIAVFDSQGFALQKVLLSSAGIWLVIGSAD